MIELNYKTAEELQRRFEQLCAMDELEFQKLWEDSEMHEKIEKFLKELPGLKWIRDRDTIKCPKCGFGFFPNGYWFKNGECIKCNDVEFRPCFCPNCGKKMQGEQL